MSETDTTPDPPLRPASLAQLMLAGGGLRTRPRARDQQADVAGIALKRRVLARLLELDPEPEAFDAALEQIVRDLGPPYGPTRAICLSLRAEWDALRHAPAFGAWLLQEALQADVRSRKGRSRAD
jgi:hypothetical protein